MKKSYMNPELFVIALEEKDIVTTSDSSEKDMGLWGPTGPDQDWDAELDGLV